MEHIINKNISKEINDNIIIDREKNRNEELKIKEYNNKIPYLTKEKNIVNRTNKIKKDLINSIIKEETKHSRILNNTPSTKREIENKMDKNAKSVITYKPFKGKKYIGYGKSFDAKIKEKLICNDIVCKDKMKKNREMGFFNDICFVPYENINLPKTKNNVEAVNIKKIVNNLHSYMGENNDKGKYFFPRNNILNMSQNTNKLKDNLFNMDFLS